mgnify:CR=1 FL=1
MRYKENKKSVQEIAQDKEQRLMDTVAWRAGYYRANPQRFVEEVLGIQLKLFQKILIWVMMHFNYFMFCAVRGIGKTWVDALFAVVRCILYPGTKVVVTSNTLRQANELLLKVQDDFMKQSPFLCNEIEKCNIVNEWNQYNTAFEKMHLDYYLYQLHRYYKEDLNGLNECIKRLIQSFDKVEIKLTIDDFDFSNDAKEYMNLFFEEHTPDEIKKCFENIYWKNPAIIKILELNFKNIYLKYEKKITKYYLLRHQEFLKNHSDNEIFNMRIELCNELKRLKGTDPYLNFQNFLTIIYQSTAAKCLNLPLLLLKNFFFQVISKLSK